jgi:GTP-binding protein EngB required for normal cell division
MLYFSKSKEELRAEMTKLDLEEFDQFAKDIVPSFLALQTLEEINEKLQDLWNALIDESLEFESVLAMKEKISWLISRLSKAKDLPEIRNELSSAFHDLVQCIQPLNVQLMISLIQDFDTAAQMIAGKDIILILGETGAGKSTTIHFLAGSEMEEVVINGFDHIQPIRTQANVSALKVGASTQSVTKSITAIEFTNCMIVCDTPGFGETAGPEADIANGIGIIHSLAYTRSVKPVMVLSEKNMDRLKGIRKMNEILQAMFVDVPAMLPSMTYFFTKYHPKAANRICQQLTALRKEFTNEDHFDRSYVAIVDDLIAKTTPTAIIIDPLLSARNSLPAEDILSHLESIVPCENPPRMMFKTFVMPDSAEKLASQWRILQRQVSLALQNHNIRFVSKPFREMQILNKLQLEEYSPYFTDSIKQLENYALSQLETGKEIFLSCLFSRNTCEDHNLFRAYEIFGRLLVVDPLLSELSSESPYDFSRLVQNHILESLAKLSSIEDYFDGSTSLCLQLLLQVQSTLEQFFYYVDDIDGLPHVHPVFERSNLADSFLYNVRSYYSELISKLNGEVAQLLGAIENMIDSSCEPGVLVPSLRALGIVTEILLEHCPNSKMEELKDLLFAYFFRRLESDADRYSGYMYPRLNEDYKAAVSQIVKFSSHLSSLKNSSELLELLPDPERIGLIEEVLVRKSSELIKQICADCTPSATEDSFLDLDMTLYYLEYLLYIAENAPLFTEPTHRSIETLNQLLQRNLLDRLTSFNRGITKLATDDSSHDSLDLVSLKDTLEYLRQAEGLFPHFKFFTESVSLLKETVQSKIETFKTYDFEHLESRSAVHSSHVVSRLVLSDVLKSIAQNIPEFSLHINLRDETISLVSSALKKSLQNVEDLPIPRYMAVFALVESLMQFRQTNKGPTYDVLDHISNEARMIGRKFLESKESVLNNSFQTIESCWRPDGRMTQLPFEPFTICLYPMKSALDDLVVLSRSSESLPLRSLCSELLLEIPKMLLSTWVDHERSKIKTHLMEISSYLATLDSSTGGLVGEHTNMLHQLFLLTHGMIPFDKFIPLEPNYASLSRLCDFKMRKLSNDLTASMKHDLEVNNFVSVRGVILSARSSEVDAIRESLAHMTKVLSDLVMKRCDDLSKFLYRIKSQPLTLDLLSTILAQGGVLRDLDESLKEFLESEVHTELMSALSLVVQNIENQLLDRLKLAESAASYSDGMNLLSSFMDMADIVTAFRPQLLELAPLLKQKTLCQENLLKSMTEKIAAYETMLPRDYGKNKAKHSTPVALANQLQQCPGPESGSLLSTLTKYVVNKFTAILMEIKTNINDITYCDFELGDIGDASKLLTPEIIDQISELYNLGRHHDHSVETRSLSS